MNLIVEQEYLTFVQFACCFVNTVLSEKYINILSYFYNIKQQRSSH